MIGKKLYKNTYILIVVYNVQRFISALCTTIIKMAYILINGPRDSLRSFTQSTFTADILSDKPFSRNLCRYIPIIIGSSNI